MLRRLLLLAIGVGSLVVISRPLDAQSSDGRPQGFPDPDEFVAGFLDGNWNAPGQSMGRCPRETQWHDAVFTAFLEIDPDVRQRQVMANAWSGSVGRCDDSRLTEWFVDGLREVNHTGAGVYVSALLAVETPDIRSEILSRIVDLDTQAEVRSTIAVRASAELRAPEKRVDFFFDILEVGDPPRRYFGIEMGVLLAMPDAKDPFARRTVDVLRARPDRRFADELFTSVITQAMIDEADGGFSLGVSRELLSLSDDLAEMGSEVATSSRATQLREALRSKVGGDG